MGVVALEGVMEPEIVPHLPETGVDVQEDAPGDATEDLLVAKEAHEVEEEGRAPRSFENLRP